MKRLAFALLALAACSSPKPTAAPAPIDPPAPAAPVSPAVAETKAASVESKPAVASVRETDAPLPAALRIDVRANDKGSTVRVQRLTELVMVRRGAERHGAAFGASIFVPKAEEGSEPILVETTRAAGLVTTRAVLHLDAADRGHYSARLAEAPATIASDEKPHHECRAHEDGYGGFAVLCRADAQSNAGSITGEDAHENVVELIDDHSLVRFDFDGRKGAVEAKAMAYNTGGRGMLIRVETSFLEDEQKPSLVIASADRAQPVPIHFGCRLGMLDPKL